MNSGPGRGGGGARTGSELNSWRPKLRSEGHASLEVRANGAWDAEVRRRGGRGVKRETKGKLEIY
eukprot:CAMPEP_0184731180 /NCGR_PEP_ID=MMETSP0314-20130426/50075_1 /TAXON_ID=38298 /ORGANISM="Rhodella maculata, Strain CCMP 736" /LENGTH=64 /DNA_ID=CAMNT_0027197509 /DNA_START=75 /DNA_END=269 /DNA_ORIENTATION=-